MHAPAHTHPAALRPLLLAMLPCALLLTGCGEDGPTERPPPVSPPAATWNLSRLPPTDPPLESWTTPQGVLVQVTRRGEGPESDASTPIDLHYRCYLVDGKKLAEEVWPLGGAGGRGREQLIAGLKSGLERLRPGERRRVLVPAAQGFGWERPAPAMPPAADLVFDLSWPQYRQEDLVVGSGEPARAGQEVVVHYRGQLEDGSVFEDSRVARDGQPVPVVLVEGRAIAGWVKGVPGMRVGGMRRLSIPSRLGYGAQGYPAGKIPPHADLVFTVELFAVREPAPVPGKGPGERAPVR